MANYGRGPYGTFVNFGTVQIYQPQLPTHATTDPFRLPTFPAPPPAQHQPLDPAAHDWQRLGSEGRDQTSAENNRRFSGVTARLIDRAHPGQPDLAREHATPEAPARPHRTTPAAGPLQSSIHIRPPTDPPGITPAREPAGGPAGYEPPSVNHSPTSPRVLHVGPGGGHEAVNRSPVPLHGPTPAALSHVYTHASAASSAGPSDPQTASSNVHGRSHVRNTAPVQSSGQSSTHQSNPRDAAEISTGGPSRPERASGGEPSSVRDSPPVSPRPYAPLPRPGCFDHGEPSTARDSTHPPAQANGHPPARLPAQASRVWPDSGPRGHHSGRSCTSSVACDGGSSANTSVDVPLPTRPRKSPPEIRNTRPDSDAPRQPSTRGAPPLRSPVAAAGPATHPGSVPAEERDGAASRASGSEDEERLHEVQRSENRDEELARRDKTAGGTRRSHEPIHGSEHRRVETSQAGTSYRRPAVEAVDQPAVPRISWGKRRGAVDECNHAGRPDGHRTIGDGHAANGADGGVNAIVDIHGRVTDGVIDGRDGQVHDHVTADPDVSPIGDDHPSAAATAGQDPPATSVLNTAHPVQPRVPRGPDLLGARTLRNRPDDERWPARPRPAYIGPLFNVPGTDRKGKLPQRRVTSASRVSSHRTEEPDMEPRGEQDDADDYDPNDADDYDQNDTHEHDQNDTHDHDENTPAERSHPATDPSPSGLGRGSPAPSPPPPQRSATDREAEQNYWKSKLSVAEQQTAQVQYGPVYTGQVDYERFFKRLFPNWNEMEDETF
ncbi:MAG: hypothetical protein LQ348_007701 [Seirophora lacunosa]|nr:MAG: hypothetical protein LQ348_007701 [Seirophora lacunosa]